MSFKKCNMVSVSKPLTKYRWDIQKVFKEFGRLETRQHGVYPAISVQIRWPSIFYILPYYIHRSSSEAHSYQYHCKKKSISSWVPGIICLSLIRIQCQRSEHSFSQSSVVNLKVSWKPTAEKASKEGSTWVFECWSWWFCWEIHHIDPV